MPIAIQRSIPWRTHRLGLVLCGILFVGPAVAAAQTTQAPPTDSDIRFAVETALIFDHSVPSSSITVATHSGAVTLTGSADNLLVRDRAVRIAESVKGVRTVIDQVAVAPSDRSDGEIRDAVTQALRVDPAADSYQINPVVDHGAVTLNGRVDSWQEQQLAMNVAKGVRGVTAVHNNLAIDYKFDRPDMEILPEVERYLENDVLVDASLINVSVKDGAVTLTGTTGSAAETRRAERDAWVAGVKSVDGSQLSVEAWAAKDNRRYTRKTRSAAEIKKAVQDAFLYDPRVLSFNPQVTVNDAGVVRLSGVVDNLKAKQAAERDARNTVGVRRVQNNLTVSPASPVADARLSAGVTNTLELDLLLDASDIDVSAHHGVVTLTGSVDTYVDKSEAEDAAMRTNGVVAVNNQLSVLNPFLTSYTWDYQPFYRPAPGATAWPYHTDAEIKEDIQDELFWSPFVDSDDVHVSVRNGVATLTGVVDSWHEYRTAGINAIQGGARSVVNDLIMK
jgi:osmotically-inducible protein OsmY